MTQERPSRGPSSSPSPTLEGLEGTVLFELPDELKRESNLVAYMEWLRDERNIDCPDYPSLHAWSIRDLRAFWQSIWDFFGVRGTRGQNPVLRGEVMPGARFFDGATLNYAEHLLHPVRGRGRGEDPAVVYRREDGLRRELSYAELYRLVARVRAGLVELGVKRGDRVAAFVTSTPETLALLLASASLGAVWSSAAPEFGAESVLDRFRQIDPKILIAVDGYHYGGKKHDRSAAVEKIAANLPSLERTLILSEIGGMPNVPGALGFDEFVALGQEAVEGKQRASGPELSFDQVPFEHPLWVLYSSGTTGLPKPIVHGHGGILLEHLKVLSLHSDVKPGDRFFWYSTTGWMMYNYSISVLALGATLVLYDGSPGVPDLLSLFRMAEEEKLTYFGTSAPFLLACKKAGLEPQSRNLEALRAIGTTGAPLPAEGFLWVYEHVKRDVLLASLSGGTDVCTAFVLSCPLLPVRAGEIQCRGLGAAVEAYDPEGHPVIGEVGELVLEKPLPSMPLFFWGDQSGERYRESYFSMFDGVWRHGDWIKITADGGVVIYGRSDATLNRGGVRMGTSEFYSVIDSFPEVVDSLVVDTATPSGDAGSLFLFVVLAAGKELDEALKTSLRSRLRSELSPRHVPDRILAVSRIPKTLNGKKMEVPIKRILSGVPPEVAVQRDTMSEPAALDEFLKLRDELV